MKRVVNGKLYDTSTAKLIADDEFSDGRNRLSGGRGSYLYKTRKGNFFAYHRTCWEGEHDSICPLSLKEAKEMYEELPNHWVSWEDAFGEAPEEA